MTDRTQAAAIRYGGSARTSVPQKEIGRNNAADKAGLTGKEAAENSGPLPAVTALHEIHLFIQCRDEGHVNVL